MNEPCDRTAELKLATDNFEVGCNDFCDAFEQDSDRLFAARECWYCKYGDFGIYTEHTTKSGKCKYKTPISGGEEAII